MLGRSITKRCNGCFNNLSTNHRDIINYADFIPTIEILSKSSQGACGLDIVKAGEHLLLMKTSNTNRAREHLPYWFGLWHHLLMLSTLTGSSKGSKIMKYYVYVLYFVKD